MLDSLYNSAFFRCKTTWSWILWTSSSYANIFHDNGWLSVLMTQLNDI